MNTFFKTSITGIAFYTMSVLSSYAASVSIVAPSGAVPNRDPVIVQIMLDTEGKTVSGIGGNFSFPADLFTLGDVITSDTVVSLWITQPSVSVEKYFDNRVHVTFEGIFPGGYSGVKNPYYSNTQKGHLFTVTLIPKQNGNGALVVDDLVINAFSKDAEALPSASVVHLIKVPELLKETTSIKKDFVRVNDSTLSAIITRDPLINTNAWYLLVNETDSRGALEKMLVAETDDYNAEMVAESKWREAKNPYILLYQDRSKNVHVKMVYSNKTYTTKTLHAVENYTNFSFISRILVSIGIVVFLLYLYGKNHLILFRKK